MSGRRTALRGEPQARLRSRSGSAAIMAFAGVLGLLSGSSVCADEPAPATNGNGGADSVQIPRVTVTARRREEAEQDVPEMITAVSGDSLDRSGTDRVEELNPLFPSSNFQFGNARQTSLALRGLGNNPANVNLESDVGVYIDNVYLGTPGMVNINLVDLKQASLIEGPQGTLFGKNTNAGVLNITTRSPTFDYLANASATFGSFGTTQIAGVVNGPLLDNELAGRLTVSKNWQGGFVHDITDGRDLNGHQREGMRGQLLYAPGGRFSLRLIGDYNAEDSACCTAVPVHFNNFTVFIAELAGADPMPVVDPNYRTVTNDGPTQVHVDQSGVTAEAKWKLGDYRLTSITAWRVWNYEPHNDVDLLSVPAVLDQGQNVHHSQYSEEVRLASPEGPAIDYVAGLFAYYQHQDDDNFTDYGPKADVVLLKLPHSFANTSTDVISTPSTTSGAAFAQATWHITPRWRLTAGLRGTEESKSSQVTRPAAIVPPNERKNPPSGLLAYDSGSLSLSNDNLSELATLDYRPTENLMFYAGVARGAKSGAINSAVPPPGAPPESLYVQPETVDSGEFGFKSSWLQHLVQLNASAFRALARNYQSLVVVENEPGVYSAMLANVGSVRAQGIEMQLTALTGPHLAFSLNGSYVDSIYKSYPDAPCASEKLATGKFVLACDLSGSQLYGVPHWMINPGLVLQNHFDRYRNAYAMAQYSWRSSAFGTPDDSQFGRIPAYGLANFRIGISDSHNEWDAAVWANNALNKHYLIGGSGGGLGALYSEVPGAPRIVGVTVKATF